MKKTEARYGQDGEPYLMLDYDIRVWLGYSEIDGEPIIQINTSPETDSWRRLRVYMNDAQATIWRNDVTV